MTCGKIYLFQYQKNILAATYTCLALSLFSNLWHSIHVLQSLNTNPNLLGLYLKTNFYLRTHINHPKEAAQLVYLWRLLLFATLLIFDEATKLFHKLGEVVWPWARVTVGCQTWMFMASKILCKMKWFSWPLIFFSN